MSSFGKQRGLTLISLIILAVLLGLLFIVGSQVVPSVTEFMSIKKAVKHAVTNGGNPAEIRSSFNKSAEVNYIETISGKDLQITQSNGKTIVSFAYDKEIHLAGPAYYIGSFWDKFSNRGPEMVTW